ncbi:2-phosphosulfolactate phosphatase [Streptomyces sp. NBC_00820]|uniref:2-phosphosulfolactate phosphatase n=1 Tax=Streptomyces sp. NBC_00820 TaxID=2975842 RepID=UPI002ED44A31|nr:2-phosphosulfolactate phosphatase [Streptomyces sp. NBC_00820]
MQPTYTGIPGAPVAPDVAVVVDVMRAFTVAAWAFRGGAEKIVFAGTQEEALELKARHRDWLAFQDGPPVPGFDLANSPALLRSLDVRGRTVVQKTTAGTAGALAVAEARLLLCASFAVAGATAEVLRRARPERVTFVVTGDGGRAEEDLACAQYIAALAAPTATDTATDTATATGIGTATVTATATATATGTGTGTGPASGTDPAPYLDRARRSGAAGRLAEGVRLGWEGVHPQDVAMCLEVDTVPFAMVAARMDGHLVLRPVDAAAAG